MFEKNFFKESAVPPYLWAKLEELWTCLQIKSPLPSVNKQIHVNSTRATQSFGENHRKHQPTRKESNQSSVSKNKKTAWRTWKCKLPSSSWLVRGWFKVFKTNHRSIVEKPNHFLIYFGHSIKHFYFICTVEETLMLDPKKYSQISISRTTITWIFQIFRLAYLIPLCLNIYIHILIIWTLDYPNF